MKHFLLLLLSILILVACTEKSASDNSAASTVFKNGYVQCKIAGAASYRYPADGESKFAIHLDTTSSSPGIQVESDSPGKMTMVHKIQSGETCELGSDGSSAK